MISYLKGSIASVDVSTPNRTMLTVEVNGIGYELQITPRLARRLPPLGESFQVFCDLQQREDRPVFYGFGSVAERDLFRQLIRASGVGSQLALALLDTLELSDLVQAIVTGNHRILSQTPGVGKKTAERISLELRSKLSEWRQRVQLETVPEAGLTAEIQEDVEITLLALKFSPEEVMKAINALAQDATFRDRHDAEAWIKRAIALLSA
ncbi:Holliday junction branch migration protein RuvA [Baaleninema simplex]|uniref:Holliday junction branch migration protein RuvA n=1 Tax=Baaleninema simplex TaxID=2862350 RepID=UPI00034893A8|nr:Holliday junction branch migration protein RuvA [Baaleninema simplex]